ncbi:Six-hairpin glycosidase-like superfamily protein [Abortiporus biennis]
MATISNHIYDAHELYQKLFPPLLCTQRSSWEQGIAAQALLETHQLFICQPSFLSDNPDIRLQCIYSLVHDAIVRQSSDGRLAVCLNGDGNSDHGAADPACIGECFYYLLSRTLDMKNPTHGQRLHSSIDRMLRYTLEICPRAEYTIGCSYSSDDSRIILSHRTDGVEIWSDTLYMHPPFLASSFVYYLHHPDTHADPMRLLRMCLHQVVLPADILQSQTGEWSHIYNLESKRFKRKAFWGVGNGWVCCGIIRMFRIFAAAIDEVTDDHPLVSAFIEEGIDEWLEACYDILLKTLSACFKHMRPDGLYHDILDDTTSFVETNLSQQLSYTIYRLLSFQIAYSSTSSRVMELLHVSCLDEATIKEFESKAAVMYQAALKQTDSYGFVQGVCGSPNFDQPGTATEGQAWGIMSAIARAEYYIRSENS